MFHGKDIRIFLEEFNGVSLAEITSVLIVTPGFRLSLLAKWRNGDSGVDGDGDRLSATLGSPGNTCTILKEYFATSVGTFNSFLLYGIVVR